MEIHVEWKTGKGKIKKKHSMVISSPKFDFNAVILILIHILVLGLLATGGRDLMPELPEDRIEFNECILEPGAMFCFDAG